MSMIQTFSDPFQTAHGRKCHSNPFISRLALRPRFFPSKCFLLPALLQICQRTPVGRVRLGESCAIALRVVKRKDSLRRDQVNVLFLPCPNLFCPQFQVRRGMVLLDAVVPPGPSRSFNADVVILTHSTTIKPNYQSVVHCGNVRQTAQVLSISKEVLRTGDQASVEFRFISRPEYIHTGSVFLFREGSTRGIGKITSVAGDG